MASRWRKTIFKSFKSFVAACLAGEASPSDIDIWVHAWRSSAPGSEGKTLDEYLGYNNDEVALWARKPSSLEAILDAHRSPIRPTP